ncbi:hypothetical protein C9374_013534 [Naegleria lovaniensis]|uniref:Uncharacterized protein n=1 Tax=Naegleria lovaniensis TaxID=51637 RepID=A0AA88KQR6_NAELO|nr:uncharacterized protein C9374_013534 [Naegleria lovaniensis]KAG2392049.1 hypothetical protein C9374_013534 [Naegleria lovaniensis]
MKGFHSSSLTNNNHHGNTPKLGVTGSSQDSMSSCQNSPQLSSPSLSQRRRQSSASTKSVHYATPDVAADNSPNMVIPSGQPKKLRKQINTTAFKQNYFELDLTSSNEAKLLQFTPGQEKKKKPSSRSRSSSSAASQTRRKSVDAAQDGSTKKRKKPSKNTAEQDQEEECSSDHHAQQHLEEDEEELEEDGLTSPNFETLSANKRRNSTGSVLMMSTSNVGAAAANNSNLGSSSTNHLNIPSTSHNNNLSLYHSKTPQQQLSADSQMMIKHKPIYNEYSKKLYTAREDSFANIFTTSSTSFSTSSVPSKKPLLQQPFAATSISSSSSTAAAASVDPSMSGGSVLSSLLPNPSSVGVVQSGKIEKLMNEPMPLIYYLNAISAKKEELQQQQQNHSTTIPNNKTSNLMYDPFSSQTNTGQSHSSFLNQQQHSVSSQNESIMMMNTSMPQQDSMDLHGMPFGLMMDADKMNELQHLLNELDPHSAGGSSSAIMATHSSGTMDPSSFQQLCFSISQSAKNPNLNVNNNNATNNTTNSAFFGHEMNAWDDDLLNNIQQQQQQVQQPTISYSTSTAPSFLDEDFQQLGMNNNNNNNFDALFNLDNLYRAISSSSNTTSAAGSEASSYNQFDLSEQLQAKSSMFFFE